MIELGGGTVGHVHVAEKLLGLLPDGYLVASMSDLLLLTAETVLWRGREGDTADLQRLLGEVAKQGRWILVIAPEEIDVLVRAVEACLGGWSHLYRRCPC